MALAQVRVIYWCQNISFNIAYRNYVTYSCASPVLGGFIFTSVSLAVTFIKLNAHFFLPFLLTFTVTLPSVPLAFGFGGLPAFGGMNVSTSLSGISQ
jgi:hypothetical protein